MGAAIALSALIFIVGLLPSVFPGPGQVAYRAAVSGPSDSVLPTAASIQVKSDGFHCVWVRDDATLPTSVASLRCDAPYRDDGLLELEAALKAQDLQIMQPITMTSWTVPPLWATLLAIAAYLLLAVLLVRRTAAGWGWGAARRTAWRAPLLVLLPTCAALGLALVAAGVLGAVRPPSPPGTALPLGTWAFVLLPLVAAFPEEALLRGWLHERLFAHLRPWAAYLLVAEVFVLLHFTLLGMAFSGGVGGVLAAFQVAVIFGLSLLYTWIRRVGGSVALCVIAHAVYNASIVFAGMGGASATQP